MVARVAGGCYAVTRPVVVVQQYCIGDVVWCVFDKSRTAHLTLEKSEMHKQNGLAKRVPGSLNSPSGASDSDL